MHTYIIYSRCKPDIQIKIKNRKKRKMHLEKGVKRLSLCENSLKKCNKIKIKILNYNLSAI